MATQTARQATHCDVSNVRRTPDAVLALAQSFLADLHPGSKRNRAVALDSALEHDLGLDVTVAVLGEPPDEVVLTPPRTVLKTSSGKIRRSACRELYEAGPVGMRGRAAW